MKRPAALLWAGAIAGAAGGAMIALGGRAAWYTVRVPGRAFPLDDRSIVVGRPEVSLRGSDLAGEVVGLGVVVALLSVLALLLGPRVRAAAIAGGVAVALVAILGSVRSGTAGARDEAERLTGSARAAAARAPAAGLWVTFAGGVLAAAGLAFAAPAARRVPRLRLPESGPEERGDAA